MSFGERFVCTLIAIERERSGELEEEETDEPSSVKPAHSPLEKERLSYSLLLLLLLCMLSYFLVFFFVFRRRKKGRWMSNWSRPVLAKRASDRHWSLDYATFTQKAVVYTGHAQVRYSIKHF